MKNVMNKSQVKKSNKMKVLKIQSLSNIQNKMTKTMKTETNPIFLLKKERKFTRQEENPKKK